MERFKEIILVIPSYNEGSNIINLLKKIRTFETIVVDDGSTDKSHIKIKQFCTYYLRNKVNLGYQKSIEKGINLAINKGYKGVITFDADNQIDINRIKIFKKNLLKGYDLVIGIRNNIPRLSEKVFNLYTYVNYNLEDILCGLKGYNLDEFNKKIFNQNFFACTNLALDYLKRKKKIKKIQVKVNKRKGVSKFGNFFYGNIKIFNDFIREILSKWTF